MSRDGQVIALDAIFGDDETDTRLLQEMAEEAERYICSFGWCLKLKEGFFAGGFGGIVAIFLFRADIAKLGENRWTWIFVGDVPRAYLEMDNENRTPHDALLRYIEGIEEWINAVRSNRPLHELIPIEASTDPGTLDDLTSRAKTLREHILPYISRSLFHTGPWQQQ
jgi:hypothetical protein